MLPRRTMDELLAILAMSLSAPTYIDLGVVEGFVSDHIGGKCFQVALVTVLVYDARKELLSPGALTSY